MKTDKGSFRDPAGFIYFDDKDVLLRQVNKTYGSNFQKLKSTGLYDCLVEQNWIVKHEEISSKSESVHIILKPEIVSPITYPYEWPFSKLKDAALLTLDIQKESVSRGMKLKDASPYNIQFVKEKPIFIDTLSFESITEDDYSWTPYKQFCEMFLGPLCLMSYNDPILSKLTINFINGIPLNLINKLLPLKAKLKPSIFIHLVLHSFLLNKSSNKSDRNPSQKKVSKSQHLNIINQLRDFINSLKLLNSNTEWGLYNNETISEKADYVEDKEQTISQFIEKINFENAWDIGSNNGFYSRKIASQSNKKVVSLDIDWKCVEENYLINKKNKISKVNSLIIDLSNPSPSIGWNNEERSNIFKRLANPDLICCFALMHHILNDNVPLEKIVDLLDKAKKFVLIEYIPFSDPKCQKIFHSRKDSFKYPSVEIFELSIKNNFNILQTKKLGNTDRILYLLKKQ